MLNAYLFCSFPFLLAQPLLSGCATSLISDQGVEREEAPLNAVARSLILHEESDCRELIKRVLLENGHEVVAFDEEEEALDWTRSNPVDLAIVSLGSRVSQNNVWQQLKNLNKNLKILVLARLAAKDLAKKALEEGVDDYLLKPVDIEILESKVKSLKGG
jgi:DNA-binding response OmpR family regulator